MVQYDMLDVIDYDGCVEIHQMYLDKKAALDELYWEWVSEYPEYTIEMEWAYIRRLNDGWY